MVRAALADGKPADRMPLSILAACSLPLHVPEWIPRFAGAFLRVFVVPPREALRAQYGAQPALLEPLLYPRRWAHLAGVIGYRFLRKLAGKGR
jgi:hypothetical protein